MPPLSRRSRRRTVAVAAVAAFLSLVAGGLLASEIFSDPRSERRRDERTRPERPTDRELPPREDQDHSRPRRGGSFGELPPEFTAPCTMEPDRRSVSNVSDPRALGSGDGPLLPVDERWVKFESADGMTIPGLLMSPRRGGPYPGIVWVHGGIREQTNPQVVEAIARNGYVVLGVDYRGSVGHGRELSRNTSIADKDVDDVIAAGRYLAKHPDVDPGKVVVAGGSRGGAMSFLAAIRAPDVFGAVGAFYPIVDWACALHLAGGRIGAEFLRSFGGTPEEVPEVYMERSPYYRADELQVPVYMAHGLRDRRPPHTETKKMAEALEDRGVQVTTRYYVGLSHGFMEEEEADSPLWADFFRFLERHL